MLQRRGRCRRPERVRPHVVAGNAHLGDVPRCRHRRCPVSRRRPHLPPSAPEYAERAALPVRSHARWRPGTQPPGEANAHAPAGRAACRPSPAPSGCATPLRSWLKSLTSSLINSSRRSAWYSSTDKIARSRLPFKVSAVAHREWGPIVSYVWRRNTTPAPIAKIATPTNERLVGSGIWLPPSSLLATYVTGPAAPVLASA